MQIDVIIPVAAKDLPKLPLCLSGIGKHSKTTIRRIYILSPQEIELPALQDGIPVHYVSEALFPFTKDDISRAVEGKGGYANGSWYYQQLLKLYIFRAIPGLLRNVLILDSDFVWLEDLAFLTEDGRGLLAFGYPFKWLLNTRDYPQHIDHVHAEFAKRLVPGWSPQHTFSGMQHHMLFQADILEDLLLSVENTHQRPAWQAFMDQVTLDKWNAASEYVLYHHFALARYPERVMLRHLSACDIVHDANNWDMAMDHFENLRGKRDLQAAGCHAFLGLHDRLKTMDYIPPSLREQMLSAKQPMFSLALDEGLLQLECLE